ncbi:MAG: DNA polymerase III subunit beta [Clostridia bacterium]
MRFVVDTQQLNAAISTVTKALSTKTTIGILEGIYIQAADNSILLKCTDLSLQIETIVPATVEEDGAIVLPGRLFSEMARRFPNELTNIHTENNTAFLESGRAKATIQCENASEYHTMPEVKHDFEVKIKKNLLKNMIKQCIFATAQDDTKPILTGVLLEIDGNKLSMVALDGYRLAIRKEDISGISGDKKVVVPAKSFLEISRILEDTQEEISVVFSATHVLIDMGYTRIKTRLMEGEFIKYKQILPDSHTTRVRLKRNELLESIERVSLMAREGKSNIIKFSFEGEMLTLSANSELGKSNEELETDLMGNDLDIAFNSKYFSDVLKTLEDEDIYLDMNNNISPCVIRGVKGDNFYYLILPVRLFTGM